MRKPFVAGNWKMNKTISEAIAFAEAVKEPLKEFPSVEMAVCAPFVLLPALSERLADTPVQIGAQNMYWEEKGAFTGEVSPVMLKDLVTHVVIGHSERRQYFGETDETVNKKIKAALAHGLTPIFAFGESLEQNQNGETESFVSGQVRAGLKDISAEDAESIVLGYEPIWAIGTGLAATPEDANRIIGGVVRATLAEMYGDDVAQKIRIQYGGSCKPSNMEELMSQPEIDGGLVGGASLDPESFISLIELSAKAKA